MVYLRFEFVLGVEDLVAKSSWDSRLGYPFCLCLDATVSYPKGSPVSMLSLL